MKPDEIARLVRGEIIGDTSTEIVRLSKIEEAERGSLAFLSNPKYERFLESTRASLVLVSRTQDLEKYKRPEITFIRVDDPYLSFVRVVAHLNPPTPPFPENGPVGTGAHIDPTAKIGANVKIGSFVYIGPNVTIGDESELMTGVKIGKGSKVGKNCVFFPNVVVMNNCNIGNRVLLQAGCIIGVDGFGFARHPDGSFEKFPQVGGVTIGDDVEIGSNSTIARSALGDTVIKSGAKLDCLVHIGHHCSVGEHSALAAQVGLAGSSHTGKRCMMGGQSGIAGHAAIADDTTVTAQAGVTKTYTKTGITLMGFPARELDKAMRIIATAARSEANFREARRVRSELASLRKIVQALQEKLS